MATTVPDIGAGSTLTLSTESGFFAKLLSLAHSGANRADINTTSFDTTGIEPFIPADTADLGVLTGTMQFNPANNPGLPLTDVAGSIVVTFTSGGTPSTWTIPGYMNGYGNEIPMKEQMTASFSLKITGAIVVA